MSRAIGNIIRKVTRKNADKLNCLYGPSGIEYEKCLLNLLSDKVNFYALPQDGQYMPIVGLDFDFILSQSRIHQLGKIKQLSRKLHLPIVSIEHGFLPPNTPINPDWVSDGLINIYSNVMARNSWGDLNASIIPESLLEETLTKKTSFSVIYESIESFSEHNPNTYCFLNPSNDNWKVYESQKELEMATYYVQTSTNYNNFQRILKCLQSGTIVVAKDCPIIREFIIDGVTGFLYNDPKELVKLKDIDVEKFQSRIVKSYDKFFSQRVFKETFLSKLDSVNNFYRG